MDAASAKAISGRCATTIGSPVGGTRPLSRSRNWEGDGWTARSSSLRRRRSSSPRGAEAGRRSTAGVARCRSRFAGGRVGLLRRKTGRWADATSLQARKLACQWKGSAEAARKLAVGRTAVVSSLRDRFAGPGAAVSSRDVSGRRVVSPSTKPVRRWMSSVVRTGSRRVPGCDASVRTPVRRQMSCGAAA